jgi:hypothetical protein
MADNVNIIVQDTINDIVVNAAVVVETIDINVQAAVDVVNIVANPNNYVVNINRIIGEQVQSDWTQNDNQAPDYIKNKPTLAAVATSGDYDDLINTPTIPTLTSDLVNDGENGVDPFITAADIPDTPNLQQVTDAGNETGNQIKSFGGAGESTIDGEKVYTTDFGLDSHAYLHSGGYLGLKSPDASDESYLANNLVQNLGVVLEFPNKTTGNYTIATTADIPSAVTSVGLTMPSAFTVTNSPITSSGDIAVTGAGVVSQYVRGDGSLANFPTSTGGGASLSFYLNGSVSQGTIGGVAFREMDRTPILGAGTDFTINANGYIQSFITDANVPNLLEIPAGNWNFETYFSASSGGGSPSFYVELYKWNGTNLSLIASNSATPEAITNGTSIDAYFSALAVPQTTLLATDRLAVRIYVTHSGRTITLHTENSHLCQVITTFSTGITALNGLTTQVQSFATGTSGTDFAINSATATHTFNLPTASATNRGALSSTDWTTFNGKQAALVSGTNIKTINGNSVLGSGDLVVGGSTTLAIGTTPITSGTIGRVLFEGTGNVLQQSTNLFWDNTNNRLGVGTSTPANTLHLSAFNTTNSQVRIGGLELQSFSLNNTWLADNVFYNGTNFVARNTGATGMFYFLANEGQFRLNASVAGGTTLPTSNTVQLKINSNGTFAVGTNITEPNNTYTGAKFIVFGSSGNVGINTTTDAGFRLDVNGTARISGDLTLSTTNPKIQTPSNLFQIMSTYGIYIGTTTANTSIASFTNNQFGQNTSIVFPCTFGLANTLADGSSLIDMRSTTRGFLPPRMTTTQKNAIATPAAGLVVYDTTLNKLCVRTASTWETITSI